MVEGYSDFPEFEKLLEKESPSVYHEEYLLDKRVGIGIILSIIGIIVIIFSSSNLCTYIGLGIILIGFLTATTCIVINRLKQRRYTFQGLSRNLISKAIMFIDLQLSKLKTIESTVPHHENLPYSYLELNSMRESFILFLKSTKGLITWPIEIINPMEDSLRKNRKQLPTFLTTLVVMFFILVLSCYFLLASGFFLLVAVGLILLSCTIPYPFYVPIYMIKRMYLFKDDWITDVSRSDSISLEESLLRIFSLLGSKFPFPLRFHLMGEYQLLEYTGRTKSSSTHVILKEAVLYPRSSTQNEMPL
jgi:multisubunit Na+/H+ antiporter MnhG subunit